MVKNNNHSKRRSEDKVVHGRLKVDADSTDAELTAAALAATRELIATAKELCAELELEEQSTRDKEWVREAAAALVETPTGGADQYFSASSLQRPAGSVSNTVTDMPPPPPPPPSSVSIGKKPMAYQQAAAVPAAPRSARAQAKAPLAAAYPPAPPAAAGTAADAPKGKQNKIWSTSSSEERERIRDFWLALGEDERRDLVKVEKDTVLRKMKEQQKHSCSYSFLYSSVPSMDGWGTLVSLAPITGTAARGHDGAAWSADSCATTHSRQCACDPLGVSLVRRCVCVGPGWNGVGYGLKQRRPLAETTLSCKSSGTIHQISRRGTSFLLCPSHQWLAGVCLARIAGTTAHGHDGAAWSADSRATTRVPVIRAAYRSDWLKRHIPPLPYLGVVAPRAYSALPTAIPPFDCPLNAIEEELQVLYDAYYEDLEQYALYQQQYLLAVNSGANANGDPHHKSPATGRPAGGKALPPGPFPGSVEVDRYGSVVGVASLGRGVGGLGGFASGGVGAGGNGINGKKLVSGGGGKKGAAQRRRRRKRPPSSALGSEGDAYEEEELVDPDDADDAEEEPDPDADPEEDDPEGEGSSGEESAAGPEERRYTDAEMRARQAEVEREVERERGARRGGDDNSDDGDLDGSEDDGDDGESEDGDEDGESDDGDGDSEGDDDDGESDGDDDDLDGPEEVMTEEQKMEEGKRMFSIFAARMFEQRVLQAYRERVAQERQLQLLRELEDEDKLEREKEAKKQTQNQKKKDKKRQQKQAKEEKEAQKAAEKAAEEAAVKAKHAAQEEEQRKRREEDRVKREAARKAQEEEKARKEEERRKRVAEEKEKEAERERKRREKEEKTKAERRDKEERERKAREEREAKAAKEKAAQLAAAREREDKERERKKAAREREEREAKEKAEKAQLLQQQQRAAAAKTARAAVTSPTPPRNVNSNAAASGSSPRAAALPTTNGAGLPKKILNKPMPVPVPAIAPPLSPPVQLAAARHIVPQQQQQQQQQQQRPVLPIHAQHPMAMPHSQPQTPITPQMPHLPPAPMYMQQQSPGPSGMSSPRSGFVPPSPYGFGPGPSSIQLQQQQQQQQPPTPRGFPPTSASMNSVNFESASFHRGMPTSASLPLASPIGPPPKQPQLAPGRRASLMGDPGPITRPSPIARPAPVVDNSAGGSGSGSASPARRSPSPKGVLGSAALLADDDEVVPARRPGGGASWGGAQAPAAIGGGRGAPWGAPGSGASNNNNGNNGFNGAIGRGAPVPGSAAALWGNAAVNSNAEWHPATMGGAFFPPRAGYGLGNPAAASPPPHSGA
ncbi:hypothetical protein C8J57DRAFT_1508168 [Mycena rebaudengoi]|nr:hypothetical protein C8J57DRAFT_1508168 [Mycena rebaudengoi]